MDAPVPRRVMKAGRAMKGISPPKHVPLAGFGHRTPPNEGISSPLYIRAWVLQTGSIDQQYHEKVLFLQADIIWWGTERLGQLRARLAERWELDPDMIMFHASHTHGGPQTGEQFSDTLGRMDPAYVQFLEQQTESAVAAAHEHLEEVELEVGKGICEGIGVNRRKLVNGAIAMAPNPEGANDQEVTVIRFLAANKRTLGVWFHFTCHPTTSGENWVTSEYCGAAMRLLDEALGQGASCFLQGCCGDVRPFLAMEDEFVRGDGNDILRFGTRLFQCVLDILSEPMTPVKSIPLKVYSGTAALEFQQVPSPEQWLPDPGDDKNTASWKKLMRTGNGKLQPEVPFHLQLLQLAEGLSLLGLEGEVVVGYGLLIKRLSHGHTLPLGYCNGMVGYIPTAEQIREGGYESEGSCRLFGYPSPFKTTVEERIVRSIRRLLEHIQIAEGTADEEWTNVGHTGQHA